MTEPRPLVVADIGGTHARFALAHPLDAHGAVELSRHTRYLHEGQGGVIDLLQRFLADAGHAAPARACLAVAGPVHGDSGRVVNAGWRFSARAVAAACGLEGVTLVNDFAALAAAVPTCAPADLEGIDHASPLDGGPVSVVGPGTGFGVALLVPGTPRWSVVATEGGHAAFAPSGEAERELLRFLHEGRSLVEIEALQSGRGLLNIYTYLCARDGLAPAASTPADISRAALDASDLRCVEAARWFLDILADTAGDIALLHGATGGVYFGGGVLDHLRPLLDPARFRARFAAKGALGDYLEGIPLQLVRREHAALHGAAYLDRES